MARVRYRRGNPLPALASKGFTRAFLEARGLRRGLVQALLADVPDGDGEHKKFSLRRVFAHFLLAVLDEDVGSLQRAYEVQERRYLERVREPTSWKASTPNERIGRPLQRHQGQPGHAARLKDGP